MRPRGRSFSKPSPAKAQQRAAVTSIAIMRERPLTDADKVSLSRSYGLPVAEIERIFAEARRA
jgi:hypothetical protein